VLALRPTPQQQSSASLPLHALLLAELLPIRHQLCLVSLELLGKELKASRSLRLVLLLLRLPAQPQRKWQSSTILLRRWMRECTAEGGKPASAALLWPATRGS
jgi:hypothetical protein